VGGGDESSGLTSGCNSHNALRLETRRADGESQLFVQKEYTTMRRKEISAAAAEEMKITERRSERVRWGQREKKREGQQH
jgi:outer membrane lipoprotein SlyB